jgi:carbon-monoxide dehydrogenase medium subunit|tara:strand:- start:6522 stop:7301 length:780 start_codon:yes stop_codon:yes gene_type:complete
MYRFNYHKPDDMDAAQQMMADAEDGVYLSGGMTLIPTLKARLASPTDVIDLSGLALSGIELTDDSLTIGALTLHSEVAAGNQILSLSNLALAIGDAQVRNRGTIGGSIANSDPGADYPAAVVALGATINTTAGAIDADDFFQGLFETALKPGAIVTSVTFPLPGRAAYEKFPNPASRYAVVGVMVAETNGDVRVGVTGAGPCAYRQRNFEQALADNFSVAALNGLEVDYAEFNSDIHASAEYRGHLVGVMARRAVAQII